MKLKLFHLCILFWFLGNGENCLGQSVKDEGAKSGSKDPNAAKIGPKRVSAKKVGKSLETSMEQSDKKLSSKFSHQTQSGTKDAEKEGTVTIRIQDCSSF